MTDVPRGAACKARDDLWIQPATDAPDCFGEHVLVDGYGGSSACLSDASLIELLLHDLVRRLEMRILSGPVVCVAPANGRNDPGGLTAFVVVQESHISVHTFPARRFVSADVYSCRNGLLQDAIVDKFVRAFQLESVDVQLVRRGVRYPLMDLP